MPILICQYLHVALTDGEGVVRGQQLLREEAKKVCAAVVSFHCAGSLEPSWFPAEPGRAPSVSGTRGKRDLRCSYYHPPWQYLAWRLDVVSTLGRDALSIA